MANWDLNFGSFDLNDDVHIEMLDIVKNRRLTDSPIIRQHASILPAGKYEPIQVRIEGKINASNYTNLRTALNNLQSALDEGMDDFTFDDERYIRIIQASFNYSFINQRICKFAVVFKSELPFLLDNSSSSDSRTPTSGVGYTVNNGGNIQVPAKIVITANEEIDDDIQFENTTSGLLFKYRGTLSAGEELVIDCGFDQNNFPTYKVEKEGVSDMANFEGDFMLLEPGDNTLEHTGGSVDVDVYWRKGYFA